MIKRWIKSCNLCLLLLMVGFSFGMGPATCANTNGSQEKVIAPDAADDYAHRFFSWIRSNRNARWHLPYSHVGDERFLHWTITYDAAVTALAYLALDKVASAQKVIDFYAQTQSVWRLGGIIEAFELNDTFIGHDWSVRSGANIWLGIAAMHVYLGTGEEKYLDFAQKIADLILSLQNKDKTSENYGGIALGPKGDPQYPGDQHLGYNPKMKAFHEIYATEISIDAYAFFGLLYKATRKQTYKDARQANLVWLKNNAYNQSQQRFNRGYRDAVISSDIQSWAVSALGVKVLDAFSPGLAEQMLWFIEKECLASVNYQPLNKDPVVLQGVDFIDQKRARQLGREPLVSFEWSFQLANAYKRLEHDFRQLGDKKKARYYQHKNAQLIEGLINAASEVEGGLAYPYATQGEAVIGHEYKTPKAGNLSTIGAAYGILALQGYDPLALKEGKEK